VSHNQADCLKLTIDHHSMLHSEISHMIAQGKW